MAETWKSIGLTDPFTMGEHVKKAQQLLDHNPFGDFYKGEVDGVFGPITAESTRHAKYLIGYPEKGITSNFGGKLHGYLTGDVKLSVAMRLRRRHRVKQTQHHPSIREKMVKWCEFGIAHEPTIHYAQIRPIHYPAPGTTEFTTDCSGSTLIFGKWSGVPEHSGFEYNGAGSSGYMGTHMRHIARGAIQAGDLACWPFHHVAVVMDPKPADPILETHGQERGPMRITLSAEAAYHRQHGHGEPVFLSLL